MSPEVLRGEGHDFASDIWSLGCLLYELAMLRSPFEEKKLTMDRLFAKIIKGDYTPVPSTWCVQRQPLSSITQSMNSDVLHQSRVPQPRPSRYHPKLGKLVDQLMQVDPNARPSIERVAAAALLARTGSVAGHQHQARSSGVPRCPGGGGEGQVVQQATGVEVVEEDEMEQEDGEEDEEDEYEDAEEGDEEDEEEEEEDEEEEDLMEEDGVMEYDEGEVEEDLDEYHDEDDEEEEEEEEEDDEDDDSSSIATSFCMRELDGSLRELGTGGVGAGGGQHTPSRSTSQAPARPLACSKSMPALLPKHGGGGGSHTAPPAAAAAPAGALHTAPRFETLPAAACSPCRPPAGGIPPPRFPTRSTSTDASLPPTRVSTSQAPTAAGEAIPPPGLVRRRHSLSGPSGLLYHEGEGLEELVGEDLEGAQECWKRQASQMGLAGPHRQPPRHASASSSPAGSSAMEESRDEARYGGSIEEEDEDGMGNDVSSASVIIGESMYRTSHDAMSRTPSVMGPPCRRSCLGAIKRVAVSSGGAADDPMSMSLSGSTGGNGLYMTKHRRKVRVGAAAAPLPAAGAIMSAAAVIQPAGAF